MRTGIALFLIISGWQAVCHNHLEKNKIDEKARKIEENSASSEIQNADESSDSLFDKYWVQPFIEPIQRTYENKSPYEKSAFYQYMVEPFFSLDELFEFEKFKIVYCQIIEESDNNPAQVYGGIGSCLFNQIPLSSKDDSGQRQIIAHGVVGEKEFDFLITWDVFGVDHVISSYWNNHLKELSNTIHIQGAEDHRLSDFIHFVLEELKFKPGELKNLREFFSFKDVKIDEIQLSLKPYKSDYMSITGTLLSADKKPFYEITFITDYYINSKDFVFMSEDHFKAQTQTTALSGEAD